MVRLSQSSLNNEFFAKACQEWRDQLSRGELTTEAVQKAKVDTEKERLKLDPWKVYKNEIAWCRSSLLPLSIV
jgi:additional sex combs-like protein